MRARPLFLRLLTVLLLLQWGTAFAHCLNLAPAAFQTILCTPDGLVSVALPLDGQDASGQRRRQTDGPEKRGPEAAATAEAARDKAEAGRDVPSHKDKATAALCPACHGLGQASMPPPSIAPVPPRLQAPLAAALPLAEATPSPAPRAARPPPRAPPLAPLAV
ncbi:hypothetical protein IAI18_03300 [Acetobacteraceae bacterium H6797]|nr:hypothetical protein [Acetobacteraceae bacterium H6797]